MLDEAAQPSEGVTVPGGVQAKGKFSLMDVVNGHGGMRWGLTCRF